LAEEWAEAGRTVKKEPIIRLFEEKRTPRLSKEGARGFGL
jgi:hypothetical protein